MAHNTNWIGGGDADLYSNPFAGQTANRINALSSSNLGAQSAANATRTIGRRYARRLEEIESDPNFGHNAAVSQKLHDSALAEVGGETSDAYVKGAEVDSAAKAKAAALGMEAGQLDFSINKENYQREESQTFGNSFVGGLVKDAVGYGAGALVGGAVGSLFPGAKKTAQGSGNAPQSLSLTPPQSFSPQPDAYDLWLNSIGAGGTPQNSMNLYQQRRSTAGSW